MNMNNLEQLLREVAGGEKSPEEAAQLLKTLPFDDLGFANIDNHRQIRTGYPEAVFCQGKTVSQTVEIISRLAENGETVIGSRATREQFEAVAARVSGAAYYDAARTIVVNMPTKPLQEKTIAVVTAGTSDMPVSEEAAVTAEALGFQVDRIYDVGVAGIHRLFAKLDRIQEAAVIIVVAGMEGALASVVGGLVDKPVIGVPTSVGYGANFGGMSALLSMLNSCANGIGVVNIDNGFGAANLAAKILKK